MQLGIISITMMAMKWKKRLICCLVIAVIVSPLLSQGAAPTSPAEGEKQPPKIGEKKADEPKTPVLKGFLRDEGTILTAPLRFSAKDWLIAGSVLAITGVLIRNDEAIYRRVKNFQQDHQWADGISSGLEVFTRTGTIYLAGGFLIGGLLFKEKKTTETGSLALQAMIHSFVVIQLIKHLAGRQRPSWEDGSDGWHGPAGFLKRYEAGQWTRYDAFASGHTITIWSLATVIATQYRHTGWVPVAGYTLAGLCGLATITEDLHWLSDVFVGAVLGYAIGKFVVKRRGSLGKRLNLAPVVSPHYVGIGLNYRF